MSEFGTPLPPDHQDYVNTLGVMAEVSEGVMQELGSQAIAEAEWITWREVLPTLCEESSRQLDADSRKILCGVALGGAGLVLEAAAQISRRDHKKMAIGGMIAMGLASLSLFKGSKQLAQETSKGPIK